MRGARLALRRRRRNYSFSFSVKTARLTLPSLDVRLNAVAALGGVLMRPQLSVCRLTLTLLVRLHPQSEAVLDHFEDARTSS